MHLIETIGDEDLRRAWRDCKIVNKSYEDAMKDPALRIAVCHVAEVNFRKHQRLLEQQRHDRKRAQANDFPDL